MSTEKPKWFILCIPDCCEHVVFSSCKFVFCFPQSYKSKKMCVQNIKIYDGSPIDEFSISLCAS